MRVTESRFLRELANQVRRKVWRQKQEDLHKTSRAFVANQEFNSFLQSLSPFLLFSYCLSADFLFPSFFPCSYILHFTLNVQYHSNTRFTSYLKYSQFLLQLKYLSTDFLFPSYFLLHMFLHPTSRFPSYIRIFLQFLHQLLSLSNNYLFASYFTFSYLLLQMLFISSVLYLLLPSLLN